MANHQGKYHLITIFAIPSIAAAFALSDRLIPGILTTLLFLLVAVVMFWKK